MALSTTQLSALSRLFSAGVFRELAKKGRSPLFTRLLELSGLPNDRLKDATVGSAFDSAFALLRRSGSRDEYVYRAALTHNILLGRHSLNTASMLSEFRAGACKADLAILNGTSTVYEIKSDRDSLTRLYNQISNYRRVFAKIYVIAGEAHVQEIIENTPNDVGVLSLARWDRIRTLREADDRPDLTCSVTMFESLRTIEARTILRDLNVEIPDVPNTQIHSKMRDLYAKLDPVEVHHCMVTTLKKTRSLAPLHTLIEKLPKSLQPAALTVQVRRTDHARLVEAVNTQLDIAMNWA